MKYGSSAVYPIKVPVENSLKSFNFFLYQNEDSLTLIDAGMDNETCWNGLLETLNENNFSLYDIDQIVLTHHHIDHVGLVNKITSRHSVPVYAHERSIPRLKRDENYLKRRIDFFEVLYQEAGCGERGQKQITYLKKALHKNKNQTIQTDILPFLTAFCNFKIIEMPGHADDQVAFYDENEKWLFAGDLLINHISSNALIEPNINGRRTTPLLDHIESLKKAALLEAELVFPGHGFFIKDHQILIKKRLEAIENKANKLYHLIGKGYTTANDLAKTFYKKKYDQQFALVMSEIIGHLDYLESAERIQKERINGIWEFSFV
ncbi:MBL fold metallo-hydrolase [Alteribacillus sp. YIM 98480]|uniref:MBL fold metallo-hydrolase n=1 Tax=Alteribacillus sp. YIM 98480 TaxID=2606599 RepID=UPI00131E2122|nr:MBL fold metallo-hydrolase [Alteribacillus sp. YIM 98480]